MFKGCTSLIEITFPNISTLQILDASEMFMQCISLTSINLEGLKIEYVNNMESMFYDCKSLKYLNIKNINTQDNHNCENIFEGIEKHIDIIYDKYIIGPNLQLEINKNKKLLAE